jgi:lipid-A-disaccharide synthase
MKYYIIVGEASGDLHASNMMRSLKLQDPAAEFRFWGGDLMLAQGGTMVKHYKELSYMGFVEILMNLTTILGNVKFCKEDITDYVPDVLIFVDYSGFNLRIAKWAKQQGYKTNYYISPQVWASRAKRVIDIKRDIDNMFVILPFEKDFYEKYEYKVNFVGHPLIDAIANRKVMSELDFRQQNQLDKRPVIAVLPGSRKQEVTKMLGVMLSIVDDFKQYQFVIAGAPNQDFEFYNQFINTENVSYINNKTYDLLSIAKAALVASGTATLETALFKVPQIVCFKGSNISYQIAQRIITLKFISLVNLILDKEVVTELIQNDFNRINLIKELDKIVIGPSRENMLKNYETLEKKLGGGGASDKVAKLLFEGNS